MKKQNAATQVSAVQEGDRMDYLRMDYYDGDDCFNAMIECYGVDAVKNFCLCNAFKYLWRCMKKHETPKEDIEKAVYYMNSYLNLSDMEGD